MVMAKSRQTPKAPAATPGQVLSWQPQNPVHQVVPGEVGARFTFTAKNLTDSDAVILDVRPSCDCTTAEMPSRPWHIKAHETGKLEVIMDLRDKVFPTTVPGALYRSLDIFGDGFTNILNFTVVVPPGLTNSFTSNQVTRLWWQQLTLVNHQAPLKNNQCINCHFLPAYGKSGEYLYHTACGICHESKDRSSLVPDLAKLNTPISTNYWRDWITAGKLGTLMPGFASTNGGPLDDEQVRGLVDYLTKAYPRPAK